MSSPANAICDGVARGEHEDGRAEATCAQLATDRDAVDARQHHVENDRVIRIDHRLCDGVASVARDVNGVGVLAQSARDHPGELGIIFNNEQTHSAVG